MITFLIITGVLVLIGLMCLKRKFSFITPIVLMSAVIAGIICSIINVSLYKIEGPDKVWNDTIVYKSNQKEFIMTNKFVIGTQFDYDDISNIIVNDIIKTPYLEEIKENQRKDMNLIWNIGYSNIIKVSLVLNRNQYEIYKTFKDSLEQRENSL